MFLIKEKHAKYICLVAFVLIQVFNFSLAEGEISCVQCRSSTECGKEKKPTVCPNADYKKCYTQIDTNGKIERGCRKSGEEDSCKPENNCVLTDNGKNTQLICKKCDGSDDKCSQTDMNFNDTKYNQICDADAKNCIVKVDNKLVVRGCATGATECTDPNTCMTCGDDNCNTGIFPSKRIKCYQCSGANCNDVKAGNIASLPCKNYDAEDECYTKGDSDTNMARGCKSDSPSSEGCLFCKSPDCNNLKYKRDQELKCHQCMSSATNSDCYKEQTGQDLKACEKQILYSQTGYCYTLAEGGKVQRGCFYDNTALTTDKCKDGDGHVCNKCSQPDGCNKKSVEFTCIVCRSDLNDKCWNNAGNFTGEKCRTIESSAEESCFHGIWHGVAIRGCLVDLTLPNQALCKDKNNQQCTVCHGKDCNINRSSGAKNGFSFALILIILLTMWNLK